jgi:2-amino-4-hydroxy-6-hydroxymethyldihydropteridine diphosphokinase
MVDVYLGVGSNIERERYIVAGLDALEALLGDLVLSSVYDSEAVGYDGQAFLNLVVAAQTELTLVELAQTLRHIEVEYGRPKHAQRHTPRQLDIDILTYGDAVGVVDGIELPRAEIIENAFVLRPLAELAPSALHPASKDSYASLWRDYDQSSQQLFRVDFEWRGRSISTAEPRR